MLQRAESQSHIDARHAIQCDLAAETLRVTGSLQLRVFGGSMLPSVWPGDVLTIRQAAVSEIKPGELALYAHSGGFMVHRVARIMADGLITRGDAHRSDDPPAMSSQVLGKVAAIQRGRASFVPKGKLNCSQRLLQLLILHCEEFTTLLLRLNALRLKLNPGRRA